MFWYSTNHGRVSKKHIPYKFNYDSKLSEINVDINYVWNNSEVQRFRNNNSNAKSTGSILFKPRPQVTEFHKDSGPQAILCEKEIHKILIFDVTPRNDATVDMLYSSTNMSLFINDILQAAKISKDKFECYLKPKRIIKQDSIFSNDYLNEIENLGLSGNLKLENPEKDLYTLAEEFCIAISIPFTSAGLVFQEVGKPSSYYLPESLVDYVDRQHQSEIPLTIGRQNLKKWLSLAHRSN
jgi:polysaccharide biosynthesis PFTS motif protein